MGALHWPEILRASTRFAVHNESAPGRASTAYRARTPSGYQEAPRQQHAPRNLHVDAAPGPPNAAFHAAAFVIIGKLLLSNPAQLAPCWSS
jgi:hypothetical protein